MTLSLPESAAVEQIGSLLYEFLPGSGNANTAFPIAAAKAGVGSFWQGGSKRPAIIELLTLTLERQRSAFCPLLIEVVKQSMTWRRGKGNPLSREEVEQLNALLPGVGFKIPELCDPRFLDTLQRAEPAPRPSGAGKPTAAVFGDLRSKLLNVSQLSPQPRGYAFEKFLQELFEAHGLAPGLQGWERAGSAAVNVGATSGRMRALSLRASWDLTASTGAYPGTGRERDRRF